MGTEHKEKGHLWLACPAECSVGKCMGGVDALLFPEMTLHDKKFTSCAFIVDHRATNSQMLIWLPGYVQGSSGQQRQAFQSL